MEHERVVAIWGLAAYTTLLLIIIAYSVYRSWGQKRSIEIEAVGARQYGTIAIGVTIAATMLGPADAISLTERGREYGLIWVVFPLGAALAQLVSAFIFVPRIKDGFPRALSLGDIFEHNCSRVARVVSGSIVFVQMIAFSGVLVLAGGQILTTFTGLSPVYGYIYTALLVGGYSSIGGLDAVIRTDKFQFVFVILILTLCVIAIGAMAGSGETLGRELLVRPSFALDHPTSAVLALICGYFLGELLLPFYSQRALIASNKETARNGFLMAAFTIGIWYFVMTLAGSTSGIMGPRAPGDQTVIADIAQYAFNPGTAIWYVVGAVVFAGFLALVHSTFDSILNAGSVAFSRDLLGGLMNISPDLQGWIARQVILPIAVCGIAVAIMGDDLIALLMLGYTIWVPTLLPPLAWILLRPNLRLPLIGFACAIGAGLIGWFLLDRVVATAIPGILGGFVANLVTLIAFTYRSQEKLAQE